MKIGDKNYAGAVALAKIVISPSDGSGLKYYEQVRMADALLASDAAVREAKSALDEISRDDCQTAYEICADYFGPDEKYWCSICVARAALRKIGGKS